jgi:hypothetical protein
LMVSPFFWQPARAPTAKATARMAVSVRIAIR